MPEVVKTETITPAIKTPSETKGKATLNGKPKRKAAMAPLQPPVKGNGIATKITNPISSYFLIWSSTFFLVLLKNQFIIFLKKFDFFDKKFETGSKNNKRKNTGIRFPKKEIKKTFQNDKLKIKIPVGIAPLSSEIGAIAKRKIKISGGIIINYLRPTTFLTAETLSGFARVEISPSSSPVNSLFKILLIIFPLLVFGKSGTI